MTRSVDTIRTELAAVEAEIDRAYWNFTRCARGRLAPGETYRRRTALKAELRAISVLTKSQETPQ